MRLPFEPLRRRAAVVSRMGVRSQLALFLTLAIAPIGAIAIAQAMYAAQEAESLAEKALMDETRLAAEEEREAISTAFGIAAGLSYVLPLDPTDAPECSRILAGLIERDPRYVFAGVLMADGLMHCASAPAATPRNFSVTPEFAQLREDDRRRAQVLRQGAVADMPVLRVNHPVFQDGLLIAYVVLAMPVSFLSTIAKSTGEAADFRLGLVDGAGEVFVEDASEDDGGWAPDSGSPLITQDTAFRTRTFESVSVSGERRTYVVTPVFSSDVYALGGWRTADLGRNAAQRVLVAALFPAAMLVIALGVSYFAVHRLALRHIFYLARIMRAFEGGRRSVRASGLSRAPEELAVLGQAFDRLADTIERDEAELAHSVEEKTILLREVHHRVKNNLQLVISIMNMQIRAAQTPDERDALRRLQDRVMGLASIHQRLYQANDLTAVRCDELIGEVAENLVQSVSGEDGGIELTLETEPVELVRDLAVPLALFATETIMNALKHGASAADGGWLRVSLGHGEGGRIILDVANPKSARKRLDHGLNTAIGSRLIRAFQSQLGGDLRIEEDGPEYRVTLTFDPTGGKTEESPEREAAAGA